jgi:hypothetical protein
MQPIVKVYRQPILAGEGPGYVFVESAYFVPGTRPDVAAAYPGYLDNNYGWGLELLTNTLPDSNNDGHSGNGTYTLYIQACDTNGTTCAYLTPTAGVKITVNNAASKAPFGAIDTPLPGQTYSGGFYVQGWALTPQPNIIPINGTTVQTVVDGQILGPLANYNLPRSDIAGLFPGLQNTNGPAGNYYLDTTTIWNGLHTLSWLVTDSAGNASGIGSEWIWVNNQLEFKTMYQPSTPQTSACNAAAGSVPYLYTDGTSATYCGGCDACTLNTCWVDYYNTSQGKWLPDNGMTIQVSAPFNSNESISPDTTDAFSIVFSSIAGVTTANVQREAYCTLTSNLANWTYSMALDVFDPTPQITGVELLSPLVAGGSAIASIFGTNFGASGTVAVCRSGASPCTTPDIQTTSANYYWGTAPVSNPPVQCSSSCQVNVTLAAQPTASGTYNVQLTSKGDTGASAFVPNPQNPGGSSAQSNTWPVYVGPVSVSVLGGNLNFLYGTSAQDPATSNNIVIAQGTPAGGTYAWSVTPNATLVSASGNPSIATFQYASQSIMGNDTTVTVHYTYNGTIATATTPVTVTKYSSLTQAQDIDPIACNPTICSGNGGKGYNYGYAATVAYNVFCSPGMYQVQTGDILDSESVTPSTPPAGVTVVLNTDSGSLNTSGQIVDNLSLYSTQPLPSNLSLVSSQTIYVDSVQVRQNTITYSATTVTVTPQ